MSDHLKHSYQPFRLYHPVKMQIPMEIKLPFFLFHQQICIRG